MGGRHERRPKTFCKVVFPREEREREREEEEKDGAAAWGARHAAAVHSSQVEQRPQPVRLLQYVRIARFCFLVLVVEKLVELGELRLCLPALLALVQGDRYRGEKHGKEGGMMGDEVRVHV
jgi:hypothetical protein